jgi:TrmH family RNA methyltransferase
LRVVLVRPQHGGNVGAVCRAIKNFGAGELWLVGAEIEAADAVRTAVHAADVFEARRESADLAAALEGCSLVVGTTARRGRYHERSRDIRELTPDIAAAERLGAERGPALVFGPEDSGLHNRDIAACHHLAFIPTDAAYASLNLAQAAVVCLYEVARERAHGGAAAARGARETAARRTHHESGRARARWQGRADPRAGDRI